MATESPEFERELRGLADSHPERSVEELRDALNDPFGLLEAVADDHLRLITAVFLVRQHLASTSTGLDQ